LVFWTNCNKRKKGEKPYRN